MLTTDQDNETLATPDHRRGGRVQVLVPKPRTGASAVIAPGSGIIGVPMGFGRVLCYYEGNIYDVDALRDYEARLYQAYGRFVEKYPTIATWTPPIEEMTVIGSYLPESLVITDPDALERWLAEPPHKP